MYALCAILYIYIYIYIYICMYVYNFRNDIMRKLDVYARKRERCSDFFAEHVTACDCSLKKRDARVEIFFRNCGGKNLDSKQRQ